MCPRRLWLQQKQAFDAGGTCAEPADYLLESGTDRPDQYTNPVYSEKTNTIVIWAAALSDNTETLQADGSKLTGSILESDFDTKYTTCRTYPVHPDQTWAAMIDRGVWKEMDQIVVDTMEDTQPSASSNSPFPTVLFAGVARKSNFAYRFNLVSPTRDRICSGI